MTPRHALRTALVGMVAVGLLTVGALAGPASSDPDHRARGLAVAAPSPQRDAVVASHDTTRELRFRLRPGRGVQIRPNARNILRRTTPTGPLLLFLPATGARPRDYSAFLDTASATGYHVLALDYWNRGLSVARTCETDARCYTDVQANRFDGSRPGIHSAVDRHNSILGRLRLALAHAQARDPQGGWGAYLDGDRVRWSRIVVAGHSQGGGESAFIAHRHRVGGVLMFSAPVESVGTVVASWMRRPGATSSDRMWALDSTRDLYYPRIAGSWRALGLDRHGLVHDVDRGVPRGDPHRLVTNVRLGGPLRAHGRTIGDGGPRTALGHYAYAPAWRWMLERAYLPLAAG